jgi:hypothetical protein
VASLTAGGDLERAQLAQRDSRFSPPRSASSTF